MKNGGKEKKRPATRLYLANCKKPVGRYGGKVVGIMNERHAALTEWAFGAAQPEDGQSVLDVGCGGGGNILRLLQALPASRVDGVDYSAASVSISREVTRGYRDRCDIAKGDVSNLPYADVTYDVVTAVETVYFWKDVRAGLKEIRRILKKGGRVIVVCEMSDPVKCEYWTTRCKGMTVYTVEELRGLLEESGFGDVTSDMSGEWCVVTGVAG